MTEGIFCLFLKGEEGISGRFYSYFIPIKTLFYREFVF